MEKPKHCPFCGRAVMVSIRPASESGYSYKDYSIKCETCGVELKAPDRGAAIERWNSRQAPRDPVLLRPTQEVVGAS